MPRTEITVQEANPNKNAAITYVAADSANGMMFVNDGRCIVLMKNGGGGASQLTVTSTPGPQLGRTQDIVKSVGAGLDECVGLLTPSGWNQTATNAGKVHLDWDVDTSVLVAVIRVKT